MSRWVKAARMEDLSRPLRFESGLNEIAVFRCDDTVHAVDDICSHEYSRLSEGEVWDCRVYCPKHGSAFDLRTGEPCGLPAVDPVRTYPVKREGEDVYVLVDDDY